MPYGNSGPTPYSESGTGCPPVVVRGAGLLGGRAEVAGDMSSQFLSALLLAAPVRPTRRRTCRPGALVSKPYVAMTLAVMRAFGAAWLATIFHCDIARAASVSRADVRDRARRLGGELFLRRGGHRRGQRHASRACRGACRATWRFAIACGDGLQSRDTAGGITVRRPAARGDRRRHERHQRHGADARRGGPLRRRADDIRNVGHIRHKETDRIAALADGAAQVRRDGRELADGLRITPRPRARRRDDRHLQRSSHGNEHGAGRADGAGRRDPRSRLRRPRRIPGSLPIWLGWRSNLVGRLPLELRKFKRLPSGRRPSRSGRIAYSSTRSSTWRPPRGVARAWHPGRGPGS